MEVAEPKVKCKFNYKIFVPNYSDELWWYRVKYIAEDFLLSVYFATKYVREESTSYTSLYKKTPKSQSMAQYLAPRIVPW